MLTSLIEKSMKDPETNGNQNLIDDDFDNDYIKESKSLIEVGQIEKDERWKGAMYMILYGLVISVSLLFA